MKNWPNLLKQINNHLILIGLILFGGCTQSDYVPPTLLIDESVADDFAIVAKESWLKFLKTFEQSHPCIGTVTVKAGYGLADRAFYIPESSEVTVRVPATRPILESALIHEWAHHLEFHCDTHVALREPFLELSGFPTETPWRPHDLQSNLPASKWAEIPSEQYAETVVAVVLGHRSAPTNTPVTKAGIELVEKWAIGDMPGK